MTIINPKKKKIGGERVFIFCFILFYYLILILLKIQPYNFNLFFIMLS